MIVTCPPWYSTWYCICVDHQCLGEYEGVRHTAGPVGCPKYQSEVLIWRISSNGRVLALNVRGMGLDARILHILLYVAR